MVGGNAYEFGVGAGESSYTSWAVVSLLDWQQPTLQAAFVGYYNAAGGMLNLDKQLTTRGTCCFRTATGALGWGLSSVTPFASDGTACDTTAFDGERIHVGLGSSYRPPPLPASFFVSNPPGTAVCSTGDYFAIFARITAF